MNNFYEYSGASLYGNYRTRTFSDIFGSYEIFLEEWNNGPFKEAIAADNINYSLVYYLLYARYGNSSIAASDENRFKFQLFSIIFQYGPTWAKELALQKEIRSTDIAAFQIGSRNIVNIASNPSGEPSTQDTEELPYVNNQNVSKTERSLADAYALVISLLKTDVTEDFIRKFQKLFLNIVEPERPLWYETYTEEDNQ